MQLAGHQQLHHVLCKGLDKDGQTAIRTGYLSYEKPRSHPLSHYCFLSLILKARRRTHQVISDLVEEHRRELVGGLQAVGLVHA